ncbi:MAG: GldG family protein, partial [Gammaproteobacteria bacterium]
MQPLFYTLPRAWSEIKPLSDKDAVFSANEGDTAGPLLIAAALTRNIESAQQQRIVIIGDSDFIANGYIGNGENLALSVSVLQWLVRDDKRISLLPYRAPDSSIEFSNVAIASLASSYLLIVPLGVLLTGIFIGMRRRKA